LPAYFFVKIMSSILIYRDYKAIKIWLIICLLLVAMMVLVGGYTRLSGSGLSITEWKPIHGIIPPIGEVEWQEEFDAYQASPQFKMINSDMDMDGFRQIFWPEYIHRVLARLVGIVFFVPLLVFMLRRSISKKMFAMLAGIFALGGFQGAIGWVMVKSGLQSTPYVSHLKLALHLSVAFIIYALILWMIMKIGKKREIVAVAHRRFRSSYSLWFALLGVQIVFGAFMAGLHAGLVYNTWPDMNGQIVPDGLFAYPLIENREFVQFIHRQLAAFLAIIFILWFYVHREYIGKSQIAGICWLMAGVVFFQFTLGVFTLLYQVPLAMALAHQMTALLLWTVAVWLLYRVKND
jgi:cytochrome c oxidase assembly protein subunit 15